MKAGWLSKEAQYLPDGAGGDRWNRMNPREKLNWKDRSELEAILESVGIASYPNETDDQLIDAILANIEDGTLDVSVVE